MDPLAYAPAASNYAGMISQASQTYGVPANILAALIQQESSYNPSAVGGAGEVGLTQISPALAQSMGLNQAQLLDPQTNINAGASYLASLFGKFGNWSQALQAYNAGPGAANSGSSAGTTYASNILNLAAATGSQIDPSSLATALQGTSAGAGAGASGSTPSGQTVSIPGAPAWLNSALSWAVNHLIMFGAIALAIILIVWAILSLFKEPAQKIAVNVQKAVQNDPEALAAV